MPRTSLRLLKTWPELRAWRAAQDPARPVHLVPTMGALHEGHLSLFRHARSDHGIAIASLFVNPLQFERKEDLVNYPRTVDEDCAQMEAAGVEAVYMPDLADMYGADGCQILLDAGPGGEHFEGAARPGHFGGMLTVVHKLFQRVQPQRAFFGEKDAQQLFLVQRMAHDLDFPVEVVGCPIVREDDGLALSSRNVHLTPSGRVHALGLSKSLVTVASSFEKGSRDVDHLNQQLHTAMEQAGVQVAYANVIDEATFLPLDEATAKPGQGWRAVVAGRVEGVHLLDNRYLGIA